jgi:hypothetical protein
MYRLVATGLLTGLSSSLLAGLWPATSAWAGQPGNGTQPVSVASVAPAAAPDRVYPPLPTLTMLPPGTDDEEEATPRPTARKKKTRATDHRLVSPPARLVVSDASRAYLGGVEKQLDLALDPASSR